MEDRFERGFMAGIIGGLVSNGWSMFAGALDMTTVRQADLIALLIYGHVPPFGWDEITLALVGHVLLSGILGIVFAYSVLSLTSRNLLLKGWIFSITAYLLAEVVPDLFQVPGLVSTPFKTALCDLIGATIFGLVLPVALRALSAKEGAKAMAVAAPAMKSMDGEDTERE